MSETIDITSELERWLTVVNASSEGAEEDWTLAVAATPPGVAEAMRALLDAHRHVEALQAAVTLGAYWHARAEFRTGAQLTRAVLDHAVADGELRARALASLAVFHFRCGDTATSKVDAEQCLVLSRTLGDPELTINALASLARVGLRDNNIDLVRGVCAEGMSVARAAGRPDLERLPLHCLAEGTRLDGDLEGARPLYQESIALNRRLGRPDMVAMEQSNLAALELADGHPERAGPLLIDALSPLRSIPNGYLLPYALINTGGLMLAEDKALAAARLLAAAQAMFDRDGAEIDPADRPVFDSHVRAARAALDTDAFDAAWAAGSALHAAAALEEALASAMR